ncbi:MAG: histidine kinase [Clostridia bacterium]|nr:histidine kinase [Clostridia bacterium]
MSHTTRILCRKYTDLTDGEISCIEEYNDLLPALANAEKADVFIDCRTFTGRSAIVVCEAKPQTIPSNYQGTILGMLIQWRDEPAVDRSFRLGVATVGVRAVSMPEDKRIVQTVEPIFHKEKLIAVLIYERPAMAVEDMVTPAPAEGPQSPDGLDWSAVVPHLHDAVLFLDESDSVCGYNRAAGELYRKMGYIGDIMGMSSTNIQPATPADCDERTHESVMVNRSLQYQKVTVSAGKAHSALIIRDMTERRRLEEELSFQKMALRELRHRMKNSLQMIASLTRSRGYEVGDPASAQTALLDTANRLLSITATLDGIVQISLEKVSLLQVLEQIRKYALQTLLTPAKNVAIRVTGEDVEVSANCATSVALVVNELVQNALKYAFPAGGAGTIGIELQGGRPLSKIIISDDGVGFQPSGIRPGSMGLELAASIIHEKLMGEWSVESDSSGTRISIDFLEK